MDARTTIAWPPSNENGAGHDDYWRCWSPPFRRWPALRQTVPLPATWLSVTHRFDKLTAPKRKGAALVRHIGNNCVLIWMAQTENQVCNNLAATGAIV